MKTVDWIRWLIFLFPVVVSAVILIFIFFREIKHNLGLRTIKWSILIVFITFFLQLIAKILFSYWQLKHSEIGPYLLKDREFVFRVLEGLTWPYVIAILGALFLAGLGFLARRLYHKPILSNTDLGIMFLGAFIVGYPSIFIWLFGSILVMIIFALLGLLFKKFKERLSLAPFLIAMALVIVIISNFDFYLQIIKFSTGF